jgi:hypothetical protein
MFALPMRRVRVKRLAARKIGLRGNAILGLADACKEYSEIMLKGIEELSRQMNDKQNNFLARHLTVLNTTNGLIQNINNVVKSLVVDNARIIRNDLDVKGLITDLKKGRDEKLEFVCDKLNEVEKKVGRNQNTSTRKKNDEERRDSSDDEEPNRPTKNVIREDEEGNDIIKILRKERGIRIINDRLRVKTFNWGKEVDLLIRLWHKYEDDECKSKEKVEKYVDRLMESCNRLFTCSVITRSENPDKRIINMRSKEKLSKMLKDSNHVTHPFIIQCLYQGCCKYFGGENKLKKYLQERHNCGDIVTNNLNIYGIAQLYHKDYV